MLKIYKTSFIWAFFYSKADIYGILEHFNTYWKTQKKVDSREKTDPSFFRPELNV